MRRKTAWFIVFFLFLGHQILQKIFGVSLPYIDDYLDPFLGMALLLLAWQKEQALLFDKKRLQPVEIIILTVIVGLFFEFLLPVWHSGFTKDPFDLIFYSLGALLFINISGLPD